MDDEDIRKLIQQAIQSGQIKGMKPNDDSPKGPISEVVPGMNPDLYRALRSKEAEQLRNLLEQQSSENQNVLMEQTTPTTKKTPLHIAAMHGNEEVVQEVCRRCPSLLTAVDSMAYTPLHAAAEKGHVRIVQVLIDHARRTMQQADSGDTTSKSNLQEWLKMESSLGHTVMDLAALNGHLAVVKVLTVALPSLLWMETERATPLYFASGRGHWEIVDHILTFEEARKNSLQRGVTPMHHAIASKNEDTAAKLMKKVPGYTTSVDSDGDTPLHIASYMGLHRTVHHLLMQNSMAAYYKNKNGQLPIHMAAAGGHIRIYRKLIKHCPDTVGATDGTNMTVLHLGTQYEHLDFVRYILQTDEHKELINARDNMGSTALHIAIIKESIWTVFLLLDDKRVSVHSPNKLGDFPRDIIAEKMKDEWGMPFSQKAAIYLAVVEATGSFTPESAAKHLSDRQSQISGPKVEKKWEKTANTLLVAATLIATVSFASIFTLPGEYESSGSKQGLAYFRGKAVFHVFILLDALALFSSIVTAIFVIVASWTDRLGLKFVVPWALKMTSISFFSMSSAFTWALGLMLHRFSLVLMIISLFNFITVVVLVVLFAVTSPAHAYWRICVALRKMWMFLPRLWKFNSHVPSRIITRIK